MEYSNDTLMKMREFGEHGTELDDIIFALQPEDEAEFIADFNNPKSILAVMYNSVQQSRQNELIGLEIMIKTSEAEMKKMDHTRMMKLDDLIYESCGLDGNDTGEI